ncbi:hypothetical protein LNQ82_09285 [Conchiformibius steedae DSM 2580]|uniref:Uncharacterized protein n=1 Tax=Conchiformibius steedae DSM 2580 TaxID=1121352 RepID=A0AAE9HSM5_9NEIS|nr:hypothetical protein [Conchiformibius steedae]QMT32751.1 hypothetical protein H3L98_06375 [Conchiformibius steedae]URD67362.1 hypothetical protein LNQ82_09285 [Conchiformibius steedae DSM 2580]
MPQLDTLLREKIAFDDYSRLIAQHSSRFSAAETALLQEILRDFTFDTAQAQALANAVLQQSRFDPNAAHIFDDDEDFTGVCPHCLNPPVPPLRDYQMWREQNA